MTTAIHTDTTDLDEATLKHLENYSIHQTSTDPPAPATAATINESNLAPPHTQTVRIAGVLREAQNPSFDPTLAAHPLVPYPVENPHLWGRSGYRKVPDYRPVNRELDREERRQSPLFTAVGMVMIAGCSLIANWSSLWRNTAGRVTDFGVGAVGGEW